MNEWRNAHYVIFRSDPPPHVWMKETERGRMILFSLKAASSKRCVTLRAVIGEWMNERQREEWCSIREQVWGCLSAGGGNVYASATVHFKEAVTCYPAYIAFKITDTIILSLEVEVPYLQHQVKSSHTCVRTKIRGWYMCILHQTLKTSLWMLMRVVFEL